VVYINGLTGLLAMQKDGAVYYVLKDHLGSTRVLVDETGTVAAYYDYAPFGNVMRFDEDVEVSYKFTAQEFDSESGLHNFRARLYDSDLGRFYAMDAAGQFASPFLYAGNNPVVYVDPDGEFVPLAILAGAVIIGGTINVIANWEHIENVWQGLGYFAIGGTSGALAATGNPLGFFAGGFISGAGNTALSGGNLGIVLQSGFIGGFSGLASGYAGQYAAKYAGLALNNVIIKIPILTGLVKGGVTGIASGFFGGGVGALVTGQDFWSGAVRGAKLGFFIGLSTGVISATAQARKMGIDPFTGKLTGKGGSGSVLRGQAGVNQAAAEIKAAGGKVLGREVSFRVGETTVRADLVAEMPNGDIVIIEAKVGATARLSGNQAIAYPLINQGVTPVPFGGNAIRIIELNIDFQNTRVIIMNYGGANVQIP